MVSVFRLPHTQFHAGFVCNFLSSSAGLNLCSCFLRLTLAFYFRFWLLWAFHSTGFTLLPFSFLTPAVFAFFRPLQFWVLTTQPLFLLFPFLPVSASQRLLQCAPSAFASWFSPFFPAWFPVHSFPVPVLSVPVCFLLPYPDSLPQLFLRCLPSVFTSGIFRFPSAFFRPLRFHFRLLSTTVLPFRIFPALPHSGSSGAPFLLSLLRSSPLLPGWFPIRSFQVPVLGFLLVSFRSSLLRSRSCSTGDPLLNLFSGADA